MARERRAMLQLLGSLADAKRIDWTDEALRDVPAPALARLRLIARIAETQQTIATDRSAPQTPTLHLPDTDG